MDAKMERRKTEVGVTMGFCGPENVACSHDLSKIKINHFPLPKGLNRNYTSVLIQLPPGYGYYDDEGFGPPIEEVYIDAGLKFIRNGKAIDISNYFGDRTSNEQNKHLLKKGWFWVCLYSKKRKWSRQENVTTLLQQLWLFLSDPERHNSRL